MPSSPGNEHAAPTAEPVQEPDGSQREPEGKEPVELRERYEQLDDRYRRALADLDNYRKRAGRDVEERVAQSRDRMLLEWLESVDSLERAIRAEPENPLAAGLRAVLDQMESILERQGVRRFGEAGEPFDPERHEAVGVLNTDQLPDRTVAEVARSGYARGNQVLRPAQVLVAQRGQPEQPQG